MYTCVELWHISLQTIVTLWEIIQNTVHHGLLYFTWTAKREGMEQKEEFYQVYTEFDSLWSHIESEQLNCIFFLFFCSGVQDS